MEQGPDLSELQQRVEVVGERFGEMAEDSRQRGERLADLLDEVESGFVRDRLELDRLRHALARAHEENTQILALLKRLLTMAEHASGLGERAALYDLEDRVDRLYDQTVMLNGSGKAPQDEPEEAARNAGAASQGAHGVAQQGEAPHDKASEDPQWERIPDEDYEIEEGDPLDLTRMVHGEGGRENLRRSASRTALVESSAVQDIFKRVSMITGRLRET